VTRSRCLSERIAKGAAPTPGKIIPLQLLSCGGADETTTLASIERKAFVTDARFPAS
jgi:hypothetical protein